MNRTFADMPQITILVVDDTPRNLHLLQQLLTEHGYNVCPVPSGARALKFVQTTPPDLILLDIKMPDMDGYQVCERLKADERTRDIPIIFLSALRDVTDKVKGFEAGGVDYITKPFQAEEVLARVETHLTLRRLQHELQQEIARRTRTEEELRILNQRLKEANNHLEDTNQQLHEANACKDKFFSIVAHDLRGPFSGLLALTEALIEDIELYSKDQIKIKLHNLHSSSEVVYTLLKKLLTWSHLERGLIKIKPETFVLYDAVDRNFRLLASQAKQKQIPCNNLLPRDTTAYADENMIDTVLRNLFSNALKFTESGGAIEVSLQYRDAERVELVVADTGIGMTREQIEKLFRVDKKSSRPGTAGELGTGLGLILCKELVERNGGHIHVESEPGAGSRFIVTLPVPEQARSG